MLSNKRQWEEDHQDGLRRCSGGRVDDDDKRRRRSHKHLYVTLDDWSKGFSIYKIDTDIFLDDNEEEHEDDEEPPLYRLEPPILRLESPAGQNHHYHGDTSFSALGTKIFALMNHRCGLVYDTETAVVAVGPHVPEQMANGLGAYFVPVDDTLYALWQHPVHWKYSLSAMSWGPTAPDAMGCPTVGWSWKQLPSPPAALDSPVSAYALHPDGHHILFSMTYKGEMCTYSFDTKRSVWTWLGNWALPFQGQGHFDDELDAWVGICFDGTVCACKSISPTTVAPRNGPVCRPLSWKATKERLAEDQRESSKSFSVSLTPAGSGSKFCLVERLARDLEQKGPNTFVARGCELRVTMFRLMYNDEGQLQTSSRKQRASFTVSRPCRGYQFRPGVFRM